MIDNRLAVLSRFLYKGGFRTDNADHKARASYGDEDIQDILDKAMQQYKDEISKDTGIMGREELERRIQLVKALTTNELPSFIPSKYGGCHPATCSDPVRNVFR